MIVCDNCTYSMEIDKKKVNKFNVYKIDCPRCGFNEFWKFTDANN